MVLMEQSVGVNKIGRGRTLHFDHNNINNEAEVYVRDFLSFF